MRNRPRPYASVDDFILEKMGDRLVGELTAPPEIVKLALADMSVDIYSLDEAADSVLHGVGSAGSQAPVEVWQEENRFIIFHGAARWLEALMGRKKTVSAIILGQGLIPFQPGIFFQPDPDDPTFGLETVLPLDVVKRLFGGGM